MLRADMNFLSGCACRACTDNTICAHCTLPKVCSQARGVISAQCCRQPPSTHSAHPSFCCAHFTLARCQFERLTEDGV